MAQAPSAVKSSLDFPWHDHSLSHTLHLAKVMSRASKITLATTCAFAIGTVAFVHRSQQADKAVRRLAFKSSPWAI